MTIILADIGGTNIRLAIADDQQADASLQMVEILRCDDFARLEDALGYYCDQHKMRPDKMVLAVAAELHGDDVSITNNHWQFQGAAAAKACGASRYLLVNDFCAQAMAHADVVMPDTAYDHCATRHIIRSGHVQPKMPLLISGPGTGLGVAALVPVGTTLAVVEGEGGHVSFAARNAAEKTLLDALQKQWGHVSAERIVSGPGLETIYHILTGEAGQTAAAIGAAAQAGTGASRDAVNILFTAFATVLANAALSFGAGAGIVIAGGIMPKLVDLLPDSGFFERLGDHGRRSAFLKDLPLYLSTDPHAGLKGALVAAKAPYLAHRWQTLS